VSLKQKVMGATSGLQYLLVMIWLSSDGVAMLFGMGLVGQELFNSGFDCKIVVLVFNV
jgi:hypothetical protein